MGKKKDDFDFKRPAKQASSKPKKKGPGAPPPPVEYRWKKGQSGNPQGRKPNLITRALKDLTVETYREVIKAVCTGNLENLQAMVDDPSISALQVGVAQAFLNALKAGDYSTIERIAERIVGKIPDELNVNSKNFNANLNAHIDSTKVKAALQKLQDDI